MKRARQAAPASTQAHPLEAFATDALRSREALTVAELAELLGGRATHHTRMAAEVLLRMERRGLAWSNDGGQYRLAERGALVDGLVEVPCCGYRPAEMPPGYESIHEQRGEAVGVDELVDKFADWVEDTSRKGAVLFLAKAVAIGPDGRPV